MFVLDLYNDVGRLLLNPKWTLAFAPLLWLFDLALTYLIILKIPYTEIDFTTYMKQVSLYRAGERNYTLITGPTGPLVYPAGHVYIYDFLYELTDSGNDIRVAQLFFGALYLLTLGVVMGVYIKAKAPPFLLPLLVLSKRLHSIFVLRLFNDCFAALALWTSILLLQSHNFLFAAQVLSLGVSVKMSLLPALPGFAAILALAQPVFWAVVCGIAFLALQVSLAVPFISVDANAYLGRAFEFSRQFLFRWTVNWRFLGEETFLSGGFSKTLLALHVLTLLTFVLTRWVDIAGASITRPSSIARLAERIFKPLPPQAQATLTKRHTPQYIATTVLVSMAIGMLFARSMHYQFFAYISWMTPFLLWRAQFHPVLIYLVCGAQEWAWNVFPSTSTSSIVVVAVLAIQVFGVFLGSRDDFEQAVPPRAKAKDKIQ